MAQMTCPTCGAVFDTDQGRALPFCSPRCKQIDLGRWLNEEQRVPYEDLSDPDEASDGPGPIEPARK